MVTGAGSGLGADSRTDAMKTSGCACGAHAISQIEEGSGCGQQHALSD